MPNGECTTNGQRRKISHWLLGLTLLLLSCDVTSLVGPAVSVPPTLPPEALGTVIVETANAAGTQTAIVMPSTFTPTATAPATKTPTVTPSPTATFLFILATPTRTPAASGGGSGDYACRLVDQTPADGASFTAGKPFSVTWVVENSGSATWDSRSVDFVYLNGVKMSQVKAVDLPTNVAPGDQISLKVSMTAPSKSGDYKTVWALHAKEDFCKVNINIVVP